MNLRSVLKGLTATNTLGILVNIVIIILLSLLIHQQRVVIPATANVTCNETGSSSLVANDTACDQTTECKQGFTTSSDGLSCIYLNRPTNVTNCTSACYSQGDTYCNGNGQCVGNVSACTGQCESTSRCQNDEEGGGINPLNENVVFSYDPDTGWTYASWYQPIACWYGRCMWGVLDIFAGSTIEALFQAPTPPYYNFTVLGAQSRCKDYFLPDFLAAHKDCLMLERYMISSDVINYDQFSDYDYGNESFPFQTSICLLSFSCSIPTEAVEEEITRKRDLAIPFRTREQWGFRATGNPLESPPSSGPLGIRHPALQNLFWSNTRAVIEREAPTRLPPLLKRMKEQRDQGQKKKTRNANVVF